MIIKDSKYIKINIANPLFFIFNKVNGYFEEIHGNKFLMLVSTNERNEKIKKYEELWSKIRDLIGLVTKTSEDYHGKFTQINFNSDDELPLNKTIEIPRMIIIDRADFNKIANIIHANTILRIIRRRNKNIICETKIFYILLTIALLIAISIYCYLIKYKAIQKHLSPLYITNNELKEISC